MVYNLYIYSKQSDIVIHFFVSLLYQFIHHSNLFFFLVCSLLVLNDTSVLSHNKSRRVIKFCGTTVTILIVICSVIHILRANSRFVRVEGGGGVEACGPTPTQFTNLLGVRITSITDLITNLVH